MLTAIFPSMSPTPWSLVELTSIAGGRHCASRRRSAVSPVAMAKAPSFDVLASVRPLLEEDGRGGDLTSLATVPEGRQARATFLAKADGVVAGLEAASAVFRCADERVLTTWNVEEGASVRAGTILGAVQGDARALLLAERTALNLMQRMSGVATLASAMARNAAPAVVLDTRKTAPGLRLFDKWAVRIGGGRNHRMGLDDMMMIKDNHVAAAGGVGAAVDAARRYCELHGIDIEVEVEARTLQEVSEVLAALQEGDGPPKGTQPKGARVSRILLDNMARWDPECDGQVDVSMLEEALRMVDGRLETEASGNVTLETVGRIGQTGVTYVSSGALTHSVPALDISLNFDV